MIALALLAAATLQDHSHAFPGGAEAPARRCESSGDEVTICGDRDQSGFRVPPLPPRYREKPLKPEFQVPSGKGKVEAVQRGVGGVSVPAAMVTLRFPLGKKARGSKPAADAK